ncbi:oxidoreductase [Burkholderia gladioli]|uniref:oxidoreductase n=1 Tax=Burkholderia gladioli TaxID=28095 RepID=UPI00202E592B|nr:oxidoreductase [Burkholderia gladioli]URV26216.1 oxidoreductase [Burkholderia gladioli]
MTVRLTPGRPAMRRRDLLQRIARAGMFGALVFSCRSGFADIVPLELTVSGNIDAHTDAGRTLYRFDRAALEALPQYEMTTSTPWTPVWTFRGPRLEDILERVQSRGSRIDIVAYDGYVLHDVQVSDVKSFHPLLAYMANHAYLRLRDLGPLFLVYSRDDDREILKAADYTTREIRQIKAIVVK